MKKNILIALLVLVLGFSVAIQSTNAKNCTKGKQCGNTCIAMSYTCHVGTYETTPSYTYPSTSPLTPSYQTIIPLINVATGSISGSIATGSLLSGSIVDTGAVAKQKLDANITLLTDKYLVKNSKKKLAYHKSTIKKYYKNYLSETNEDKKYILKGLIDRISKTYKVKNPIVK